MGKRSRVRAVKESALRTVLLLFLVLCSAPLTVSGAQLSDPQVIQFTPQGTVKKVRQVTARFSEPMVPLGDPRLADPFEITCPEPGTAHWVDSSDWVYDFARDLPAGVRCSFRLVSGLTTMAGRPVGGQQVFAFSTGGPAITASTPSEGTDGIEEEQAFLLVLDTAPTEASLLQRVSFSVEGIAERIGVRLVTGKARAELLKARYRSRPVPDHVVIIQASRRFPNGAKVDLVWGKGVTSQTGVPIEQDQSLHFKVRGPFTARFSCERENRQAGCIPVTPMIVEFSAPVAWEQARQIVLIGSGGRRWSPEEDKEKPEFARNIVFKGPFPEESSFQIEIPRGLKDDAGRPLANASRFPLAVKTDPFPPLAKFSARFGIVEWKADPALPVTLRNLEPQVRAKLLRVDRADKEPRAGFTGKLQDLLERVKGKLWRIPPEQSKDILPWLRKVAYATRETSVFGPGSLSGSSNEFMLPKPHGAKAFEVVGIPLAAPGLYIVELESPRLGASLLGKQQSMYVPAAALVTNLAVHFKWGREASVAWVTMLDSGRPVPRATVTIQDCQGTVLWKGETDHQGIARIGTLPAREALATCREPSRDYEDYSQSQALHSLDGGLFVMAQTPDDMSFVHSGWDRGIEPWRFRLPEESYEGPLAAHTILDRSLLRAGETVHMKHVLRLNAMRGLASVPAEQRPSTLSIQHLGSDQKYELPLRWDGSGIAENTWQIPKEVKLGTYDIVMLGGQGDDRLRKRWTSGRFRVEEFRVPLMKGIIRLPPDPQVAISEFPADLAVQYLAGGGARDLPVTLRAQIRPKAIPAFEEFEDFTFANGPVKEGMTRRQMSWWEEEAEGEEEAALSPQGGKPAIHQREALVLDATGSARSIDHSPQGLAD